MKEQENAAEFAAKKLQEQNSRLTREGFAIFDKNNQVRLWCLGETEDEAINQFVKRIQYDTLEVFLCWGKLQAEPHSFRIAPVKVTITEIIT